MAGILIFVCLLFHKFTQSNVSALSLSSSSTSSVCCLFNLNNLFYRYSSRPLHHHFQQVKVRVQGNVVPESVSSTMERKRTFKHKWSSFLSGWKKVKLVQAYVLTIVNTDFRSSSSSLSLYLSLSLSLALIFWHKGVNNNFQNYLKPY